MMANNPALEVFLRLREEYPNRKINLVSLGTGINCNLYKKYSDVLKRITLNWIQPSLEMLFSAQSESADEHLKILAKIDPVNFNYYRLQSFLEADQLAMDKTSRDHLSALKSAALNTLKNSNEQIQKIINILCGHDEPIQPTEPISGNREEKSQESYQRETLKEGGEASSKRDEPTSIHMGVIEKNEGGAVNIGQSFGVTTRIQVDQIKTNTGGLINLGVKK
ncbi:MAG: hypothetical protein HEEMFOPI_01264 [Holosporales bacterium]